MRAMPAKIVTRPKAQRQVVLLIIRAAKRGPRKGDRMRAVAQMLIFRGCSWKKKMSLMNMRPPPAATTEKKPLRMRAVMYDVKEVAQVHQIKVPTLTHWKKRRTGRRPK